MIQKNPSFDANPFRRQSRQILLDERHIVIVDTADVVMDEDALSFFSFSPSFSWPFPPITGNGRIDIGEILSCSSHRFTSVSCERITFGGIAENFFFSLGNYYSRIQPSCKS